MVEVSDDADVENATYNGWLSEHFISSVIIFAPDGMKLLFQTCVRSNHLKIQGTVLSVNFNAPGSWHDA